VILAFLCVCVCDSFECPQHMWLSNWSDFFPPILIVKKNLQFEQILKCTFPRKEFFSELRGKIKYQNAQFSVNQFLRSCDACDFTLVSWVPFFLESDLVISSLVIIPLSLSETGENLFLGLHSCLKWGLNNEWDVFNIQFHIFVWICRNKKTKW
jgi:hypothetical protein